MISFTRENIYNKIREQKMYLSTWLRLAIVVLCVWIFVVVTNVPQNFPVGKVITIAPGTSLTTITHNLRSEEVISSSVIFRSVVILLGGEKKVIAGDYLLDTKESVFVLAYRLSHASFHLEPVKVTIPEGWNSTQISEYLTKHFSGFDAVTFKEEAKANEGYLFPDTYFFSPQISPESIIHAMRANFDTATEPIQSDIQKFNAPLSDILTVASIVEAEARTTESRKIVAGILWKRLSLHMPLQVDSTFLYINGKNTYELTTADLKINSAYNTYIHTGLPPTPINNPGLDSILATITPTATDYLYFFSAKNGDMHYAITYAEHKKNIQKYGQ